MMTDDTLDRALRDVLDRSIAEQRLVLDADPVAAVRGLTARRRRRRVVVRAALVGFAVLAVSSAVVAGNIGDRGEDVDVVAPPLSSSAIVRDGDGVDVFPRPPIDVRGDASVVWTGWELVVWGGDVEAFNMGLPGPDRTLGDGAAFDPAHRTWRILSPSPLPDTSVTPVGVMTDSGVLIVRGTATALWHPDDDSWRVLDDAPAAVTDLAWTGSGAISHSANAMVDPDTGEWRTLPAAPTQLDRPTTAWTGRELVVVGGLGTPFTGAAAIAYEPQRDEWRALAPVPDGLHAEALSASWNGQRVVVVNYDMRAVSYDPAEDAWEELPPVPARFGEWYPTLRSVGGKSVAFMAHAVVVMSEDRRWLPLPYDDISFGAVASTRPAAGVERGSGAIFVWGLDAAARENVLTGLDLDRLAARPGRVQVGIGTVELPERWRVVEAAYRPTHDQVVVDIEELDGGHCTVTSGYGEGMAAGGIEETIHNDGRPTTWFRDASGRAWRTEATSSDLFTVSCDDPEAGRAIATAASFGTT